MHHDRLDIQVVSPDLYRALLGVERYLRNGLPASLLHLVIPAASMINGCAFCVDMHATDALADDERTARLFGLAA